MFSSESGIIITFKNRFNIHLYDLPWKNKPVEMKSATMQPNKDIRLELTVAT